MRHPREFVKPNISGSLQFALWEAAIAAGATLAELQELDALSNAFKAKLLKWHEAHKLVKLHTQDAAIKKPKKK